MHNLDQQYNKYIYVNGWNNIWKKIIYLIIMKMKH